MTKGIPPSGNNPYIQSAVNLSGNTSTPGKAGKPEKKEPQHEPSFKGKSHLQDASQAMAAYGQAQIRHPGKQTVSFDPEKLQQQLDSGALGDSTTQGLVAFGKAGKHAQSAAVLADSKGLDPHAAVREFTA